MKKIIIILLLLFLCACSKSNGINRNANDKYNDLVALTKEFSDYKSDSEYFDVSSEIVKITDGYRYYVVIDNPQTAMFDVEAIVVEKNVDYTKQMAPNIGVFEDTVYSLIPNQVNVARGYVKGLNLSGTCTNPYTNLYLLVIWHNEDMSITYREFIMINLNIGANNG